MPRRLITSEIFLNEKFGQLCDGGRIFFIGCFSNADDEGRLTIQDRRYVGYTCNAVTRNLVLLQPNISNNINKEGINKEQGYKISCYSVTDLLEEYSRTLCDQCYMKISGYDIVFAGPAVKGSICEECSTENQEVPATMFVTLKKVVNLLGSTQNV